MKKNKNIILLVLILFIGIGFSYITTTFNITGSNKFGKGVFKVYFDNVNVIRGNSFASVSPSTSGTNTTELNFNVELEAPGDEYLFSVDVVNGGDVDAMINIVNLQELTDTQKEYCEYSITYENDIPLTRNNLVSIGERDTIYVSVKYKYDISEELFALEKSSISLSIGLEYQNATKDARRHPVFTNVSGDGSHTGDEVCYTSECFYVLGHKNDGNVVLVAKYPLKVGFLYDIFSGYDFIDESIDGYNLQANGSRYVVPFSKNAYWLDNPSKYGSGNNNNVYDKEFNGEPNFEYRYDEYGNYDLYPTNVNYSVAYYVENYANILKSRGLDIYDQRLVLFGEYYAYDEFFISIDCFNGYGKDFFMGTYLANTDLNQPDHLFNFYDPIPLWFGWKAQVLPVIIVKSDYVTISNNLDNYKYTTVGYINIPQA